MTTELRSCAGCSGYDCDDGCAYPGVAEEIAANTRTNSDQTAKIGESIALCDPDNDPNNGTNCGKVPELVRYGLGANVLGLYIEPMADGQYVRYDQAVEMFAAKDAVIQEDGETIADLMGKLESEMAKNKALRDLHVDAVNQNACLEAKLSQFNDQKPIAVIQFDRSEGHENDMPKVISCDWFMDGKYQVYIAPVASEAETIERFRTALQMIEAGHGCPSALARHALSGKEPS